jgi:uncharacterized protein YecT (DUF1311 family)
MMKPSVSLLLLLGLLSAPAQAQHVAALDCDTAMTTAAMRSCWGAAAGRADSTLQVYLRAARRQALNRALLDSSQAAWVAYREIACRAAASEFEGGTLQPVAGLVCYFDLTRFRTRSIWNSYLSQDDPALPAPDSGL